MGSNYYSNPDWIRDLKHRLSTVRKIIVLIPHRVVMRILEIIYMKTENVVKVSSKCCIGDSV